ncbi:hypothetical protein RhiirA1_461207 [Rhizophagus irregularis]|uniref:Uncharacterized protein n=1 Tax=Rhizophagus irregularis TaxID=588596 RepID=A0A2N0RPT8_9GLOM|nr:hypothetical protein RhiirA1_461207 [Rhizophagus irregularis]
MSSRNYGQRGTSQFINVANNTNNVNINRNRVAQIRLINNSSTIDRIARINTPQITNNSTENDFFNGTSFYDNNSFESLILPAGCSTTSSFKFNAKFTHVMNIPMRIGIRPSSFTLELLRYQAILQSQLVISIHLVQLP